MTTTELKAFIAEQLQVPLTEVVKIINSLYALVDFVTSSVVPIIPDWTAALNFKLDGSGVGKFCLYPDDNGKKRIFETKIDNNTNNLPPSNPLVTENTYWKEVSSSSGSAISGWASGLYGPGLQIVYHDHGLYLLTEPARPFTSVNINTEILAGKWERISGDGSSSGNIDGGKADSNYGAVTGIDGGKA